jgi:hypothetical protein
MSATVEDPTTIRELTRYVEHHTDLDTSYNARHEQVVVVGRPGNPESPAVLAKSSAAATSRCRRRQWRVAAAGSASSTPQTEASMTDDDTTVRTCPVCLGPLTDDDERYCDDCQPNSGWDE